MSENISLDPKAAAQVYFDGGCPVCSREIALYQRLSAADPAPPQFCDIAASDAPPAADLTHADALARLHVRRADGALVSGAEAFLALWRATPRFRLLGRALSVPPMPWVLERAYRGFLKLRVLWR
jgi:predicted DCC family thiol-disulfide oxidoreductase YuxK